VAESASPGGDADAEGESQGAELPTGAAAVTAAVTAAVIPAVTMMVKKHPEKKKKKLVKKKMRQRAKTANMRRGGLGMAGGQYADSSDEESEEGSEEDQEETEAEWKARALVGRPSKAEKLDNMEKNIVYAPFRRNFYIEAAEIAKLDDAQVKALRSQLDGVKVRGKDAPKPIKSWNQCGLASRILEVIKKSGFDAPLPIQAQSLPSIMSGRDVIGIAKTGSGKTLAFVLPMLRHAKDQPPLKQGDGMIALIMAPTRELVGQIMRETKKFAKPMGMHVVAVYGGSGVAQQISELKRGTEIVVATPGRMIDILATGTGKITNLRRVTYLVLDEADRMFDMGFEPQIDRIIMNTRADRQTVLFSATFPRQVELLAKKVLQSPIEIQVGGRSVVNPDIDQRIEIRSEEDQFLRLLELLGDWYEKGKVLVFVHSQDKCDSIFRDLLKSGYPCLSLHGGKDQLDREQTVSAPPVFHGCGSGVLVCLFDHSRPR
jgi:ATP-dependent RNA helicase DDX46/PRP5